MGQANRFRCPCGYEALEQPRHGYELVAVYHVHSGSSGWGPHSARMDPVDWPCPVETTAPRELAGVS